MFPSAELTQLAHRKTLIQARIAVRRYQCATAVVELSRPLAHIDRGILLWHRYAPYFKLFAVPAGLLLTRLLRRRAARKRGRKQGKWAVLISMLPLLLRGLRMALSVRAAYGQRLTLASRAAGGQGSAFRPKP